MSNPSNRATDEALSRAQQGDETAREDLVRQNTGLIWSAVRRMSNSGEDPEDLYQIGCVGLLKAIDRFDPSYEVQFSTYAVPLIVGEIRRYLRDQGPMRVSRSLKSLATHINRARNELAAQHGREPSLPEIAAALALSPAEIAAALEANRPLLHLEEQVGGDPADPIYLQDRVAEAGAGEATWVDRVALRQSLNHLQPRLRQVVLLRFFADWTQAEIAEVLGVSQAQISRMEQRALSLMRGLLHQETGDG